MTTKYETFTIRSVHLVGLNDGNALMLRGKFFGTNSKKMKAVEDLYIMRDEVTKQTAGMLKIGGKAYSEINAMYQEISSKMNPGQSHTELVLKYEGKALVSTRVITTVI